jgi:succinate-semialdehyde dehydrogenase/glutarate-semialdehyde dehydrogenase
MATETVSVRQVVSRDPATADVLATFACTSDFEVHRAVERARAAQPEWAAVDVRRRAAILCNFQDLLVARKQEIARLISRQSGKPYTEALTSEVLLTLDAARFCAGSAFAFLRPERIPHANLLMKAKSGRLAREPHGVIGIISPWNYPLSTPATEVLAALVTGNAVVLKPSEFTTLAAQELVNLLHEAGVPTEVLHLVPGDGSTGAALLHSPIDKLIFTGSVATGKRVAQAAAARLLPVVLELGGKDPMIVLDDADIDVASSGAVWGAFLNAGQACLSVERCYVHQRIYERFVAACVEKTSKLRVGPGLDSETDVGPLINERQLQVVESHVEDARRRGARILTGGVRLPQIGATFYSPTVMVDVDHSMLVMREETFGPVLPIMAFADDDKALALANDSEFGLAASVWTRNRTRANALARRLNAGTVMINDAACCFGISEAPHGGVKASGIGRTHGRLGLEEMVRAKYLDTDLLPAIPRLWWYGYGAKFSRQVEYFVDFLFSRRLFAKLRGGLLSAPSVVRKRL